MVVAVEVAVTYKKAMRASEKNEWVLALKEALGSIESNSTWVQSVLLLCNDAIPYKVV